MNVSGKIVFITVLIFLCLIGGFFKYISDEMNAPAPTIAAPKKSDVIEKEAHSYLGCRDMR